MSKQGFVYILTNKHKTTLYTGVTNDLKRRIAEHKLHINKGFTDKYKTDNLVYFEICQDMTTAIYREKQIKKWHREWKEDLIKGFNPEWKDLSDDIGLDEEYMQSVKEYYEDLVSTGEEPKSIGDCGSNPQ